MFAELEELREGNMLFISTVNLCRFFNAANWFVTQFELPLNDSNSVIVSKYLIPPPIFTFMKSQAISISLKLWVAAP
jgi:hypothetical protein